MTTPSPAETTISAETAASRALYGRKSRTMRRKFAFRTAGSAGRSGGSSFVNAPKRRPGIARTVASRPGAGPGRIRSSRRATQALSRSPRPARRLGALRAAADRKRSSGTGTQATGHGRPHAPAVDAARVPVRGELGAQEVAFFAPSGLELRHGWVHRGRPLLSRCRSEQKTVRGGAPLRIGSSADLALPRSKLEQPVLLGEATGRSARAHAQLPVDRA